MAVASLYFYCAPLSEAQKVGKALVRIMRGSKEITFVVLNNILTMASVKPVRSLLPILWLL